jgi:diguanylate cyclase (GGDEF)-like protein
MNRRSFMERAASDLNSADFLRIPSGIVMMDIDHFKQFNDTYGHLAGDEVLKHTVQISSAILRKNDFLGRYGGEEFVFFFSGADEATGLIIAERVRAAMENNPIKLESETVRVTASFGLAMSDTVPLPHDENYIGTLLNNADSALYRAKSEGRNRVVCFHPGDIEK